MINDLFFKFRFLIDKLDVFKLVKVFKLLDKFLHIILL